MPFSLKEALISLPFWSPGRSTTVVAWSSV
jgi:hypothetical protein